MKNRLLFTISIFSLLIFTASCNQDLKHLEFDGRYFNPQLTENTEAFLDTLQYRSFLYFIEQTNHKNGLVKDRSTSNSFSSIAAVGFAMPTWAIGAERGWISREKAAELTVNALRFFWQSEQSPDPKSTGYKGLYYHFLTMDEGKRFRNCELSTIDSGLLLAGARFAYNYYNSDDPIDIEIRQLTDSITYRIDWDWITFPDSGRHAQAMSMGWRPERGFVDAAWTGYNEALILHILAAGSGYKGAEKAYEKWLAKYDWRQPYEDIEFVSFPPLFGHQYSHMFVDFRNLQDTYMREKGIDYFQNAQRAVIVQHRYAVENPNQWTGYDSLTWGLTACDGPGPEYNTETRKFRRYGARGTSGPDLTRFDDGTIAPTAAAASIDFAPDLVIPALINMYEKYGNKGLWGKYGFYDAFNPTIDWYNPDYLGIDQGPIVLMIENWRNGFVWKYMMQDPVVQRGLQRLGFQKSGSYPFENDIREFENADKINPPPEDAILFVGSSSIRMWQSLHKDMNPIKVINRGFGGSQAEHVLHFFDRIIKPYKPRAIVFYEGDNDVSAGKLAIEIIVHYKEFARFVEKNLPGTPVYILSIKPSIERQAMWPQMQETNGLIRTFCEEKENLTFVDVSSKMLNADGSIRDDIFIDDKLHMNAKGYAIWTETIKPLLEKLENY